MPDDVGAYNRQLIAQFRETNGEAVEDRPLLLLTTTGARTGREHTAPMMYIRDGDRLMVVASNAGAPAHPAWFHNLVANPRVTVELPGDTFAATAVVPSGQSRDSLFAGIVEQYPFFAEHQAKVDRQIPVVVLERA
ncbi:nitroreductase family deazaflavin-dependent oxidoreductase [Cryptosporangium phraense]|uniref:Nitroreductase family deazaflavin-dependent oxidoreductase n=1 Tax=Cryptosporangium phraense TaxID=2593070 RepID=A0A545AI06_9ACTN|nr:nitroreductase family deazaflavin-dependent oxidoreductase [Cryptosporangium phraense]TQS40942.1 nitroreductase family deazaflavin-dependent oxidoreductase [Cryptosporangium phraense]